MSVLERLPAGSRAEAMAGQVCDITTTGRHSGRPVRIEIWYFVVDGEVYLTGSPGPRHWLANLAADPRLIWHVRNSAGTDVPAIATVIGEPQERRRIMAAVLAGEPWFRELGHPIEEWVRSSPLARLAPSPEQRGV